MIKNIPPEVCPSCKFNKFKLDFKSVHQEVFDIRNRILDLSDLKLTVYIYCNHQNCSRKKSQKPLVAVNLSTPNLEKCPTCNNDKFKIKKAEIVKSKGINLKLKCVGCNNSCSDLIEVRDTDKDRIKPSVL